MKDPYVMFNSPQNQQRRHLQKIINTKIIEESGMEYQVCNNGETLLFKIPISCEFFPSSGKWRVHRPSRLMYGGAVDFLNYLKRYMK